MGLHSELSKLIGMTLVNVVQEKKAKTAAELRQKFITENLLLRFHNVSRIFEISSLSILVAKMKALETQFRLPVYNEMDYQLKRQTEIALGEVYKEIMQHSTTIKNYTKNGQPIS